VNAPGRQRGGVKTTLGWGVLAIGAIVNAKALAATGDVA